MTIRELSEELQVSKTTIQKTIDRLGLRGDLQREGNKYIVPDSIAAKIRQAVSKIPADNTEPAEGESTESEPAEHTAPDSNTMLIELLKAEIEEKNKQIAELHLILQQQNHLLLAEKAPREEQAPEVVVETNGDYAETSGEAESAGDPDEKAQKKGFFSRLFGL